GKWVTGSRRRGDVVVVKEDRYISETIIPPTIARTANVPTRDEVAQIAAAASGSGRRVHPDLPIFAARHARAIQVGEPLPVVISGSSTFAHAPGPGPRLTDQLQALWSVPDQSAMQRSISFEFTPFTRPGVHVYNGAEGGTTAATFLTDAESQRLADLDPALLIVCATANDYTAQTPPATFEAQMRSRLEYLDARLARPCQIVLVHQFARLDFDPPAYPNSAYGDALRAIASSRADTVFVEYASTFAAVGVPGSDPLGLVDSDRYHPS